MRLIEKILDLFRKKKFYVLDFTTLNTLNISFTSLSNLELKKIKSIVEHINDVELSNLYAEKLSSEKSKTFNNIEILMNVIKDVISEDYKQTYFDAINNNWDFEYFISDYKPVYKGSLAICNKLSHKFDKSRGDVIYPILIIKKYQKIYYLWDLLERD